MRLKVSVSENGYFVEMIHSYAYVIDGDQTPCEMQKGPVLSQDIKAVSSLIKSPSDIPRSRFSIFLMLRFFFSLSLMKVITALLWIWPLPYELLTEQLEWKWESVHSKVSHKDISIIFKLTGDKEENLQLII